MKSDAWSFVPPAHRHKLGDGPFRVRGTAYAGYLQSFERRIPGGLSALYAQMHQPDVEAFLRQTIFLATSVYDIEPLMHLLVAASRISGIPIDKLARSGASIAAENDVDGKYRSQMRSTTPEEMAAKLPRIFMRYFEPCRAESRAHDKGRVEMHFHDLPASAMGFYVWMTEGFIHGALEAAGAKDIKFVWHSSPAHGEIDGVSIQAVGCRIAWTT